MRTIATIFLLGLLTTSQTPLGQLLKLPVLIEHFYKHKAQEGVSLTEFLNDHYSTEHNDSDQSEDQELPFKSLVLQNIGFAVLPHIFETDFVFAPDLPTKVMLQKFYTPQQHLYRIFHPPRV